MCIFINETGISTVFSFPQKSALFLYSSKFWARNQNAKKHRNDKNKIKPKLFRNCSFCWYPKIQRQHPKFKFSSVEKTLDQQNRTAWDYQCWVDPGGPARRSAGLCLVDISDWVSQSNPPETTSRQKVASSWVSK